MTLTERKLVFARGFCGKAAGANLSIPRIRCEVDALWRVRLLEQRHGRAAVMRLYREVGARRDVTSARALEDALARLGTTTAAFTADWRASLQRQLG